MAKKIKFPLEMNNGKQVRTLEELREYFDLEKILNYYSDGKLQVWLSDRYYEDQIAKVKMLDINDSNFNQQLCEIFGVKYDNNNYIDVKELEEKTARLNRVREYTNDEFIISNIDFVAFDQIELSNLLDEDVKRIYLCGDKFQIPLSKGNIHYIGINMPIISINCNNLNEFLAKGIILENVIFEDSLKTISIENLASFESIHNLLRDSFEYADEYEQRINNLNPIYCGKITLKKDNYKIDTSVFKVSIIWHNCLKQILKGQIPNDGYYINLSRDDAKSIFYSGVLKPVYIKFIAIESRLFIEKIFITENENEYEILCDFDNITSCSVKLKKQSIGSGTCAYGIHLI